MQSLEKKLKYYFNKIILLFDYLKAQIKKDYQLGISNHENNLRNTAKVYDRDSASEFSEFIWSFTGKIFLKLFKIMNKSFVSLDYTVTLILKSI